MDSAAYSQLLKELYQPSVKTPQILRVPPLKFAMVDGRGDPNVSPEFQDAVGALYAIAYGIKMLPKKGITPEGYFEYKISALEGVWNMPEGVDYTQLNKDQFIWTLMIMQPDFVTEALFHEIRLSQQQKKNNPALGRLYFGAAEEGLCCQMLHIGPYDAEPATFEKMQRFIEESGYRRTEKRHREIYMSDARRTAPEKLKTILRIKIEKA